MLSWSFSGKLLQLKHSLDVDGFVEMSLRLMRPNKDEAVEEGSQFTRVVMVASGESYSKAKTRASPA